MHRWSSVRWLAAWLTKTRFYLIVVFTIVPERRHDEYAHLRFPPINSIKHHGGIRAHPSSEEPKVVAILFGLLDQTAAQSLGGLFHKLLKVNHLISIHVATSKDLVELLVLDEFEAKSVERGFDFLPVQRSTFVSVRCLKQLLQHNLAKGALGRVHKGGYDFAVLCNDLAAEAVEIFLAEHGLCAQDGRGKQPGRDLLAFVDALVALNTRLSSEDPPIRQRDGRQRFLNPAASLIAENLLGNPTALVIAEVCLPPLGALLCLRGRLCCSICTASTITIAGGAARSRLASGRTAWNPAAAYQSDAKMVRRTISWLDR